MNTDPTRMIDSNTAALRDHERKEDESDLRREQLEETVWRELATGDLDTDKLAEDVMHDAFRIALHEHIDRPMDEPRIAVCDFMANVRGFVDAEVERRLRDGYGE